MQKVKELNVRELRQIDGGGNFIDYMKSYYKGLCKGLTQ